MIRSSTAPPLAALLLLLLAAAGCTGCGSIPINEEDVFMPKPSITPATFAMEGVTLHEHTIRAPRDSSARDSVALDAWWVTPDSARSAVLFFGGQGFYLVQSRGYVDAFASLPTRALMWDYRGYGNSEGTPSVQHLKRDAMAVYTYATDALGIPPERLVVHGHSLGTFVATYLAAQHRVGGVVLENPATNVDAWGKALVPWYVRLFVGFKFDEALRAEDNRARIEQIDAPLLIVGGTNDVITPAEMARTLYTASPSPSKELVIVENGGHNGLYANDAVQDAYRTLLQRVGDAE